MKRLALVFFLTLFLVSLPTHSLAQTPAKMPKLKPLKDTPNPVPPKGPERFTFIVAGDNRPEKATCKTGAGNADTSPCPPTAVVQQIFQDIKQMSPPPAFVLWSGDIIVGKDPDPKGPYYLISGGAGAPLKSIK